MPTFWADILAPKNFKPKTQLCKFLAPKFCLQNVQIKCWRNWLLFVFTPVQSSLSNCQFLLHSSKTFSVIEILLSFPFYHIECVCVYFLLCASVWACVCSRERKREGVCKTNRKKHTLSLLYAFYFPLSHTLPLSIFLTLTLPISLWREKKQN